MTTQPIEHKGYGYTFRQTKKQSEDVDFPLAPDSSRKRQEETADPKASVRDRVALLLSQVPGQGGNRMSFQDVARHRDALERDWNAMVSDDLKALGVDVSRAFRLMHDPISGRVTAGGDHPDKAKIDQYFASTPEAADDFDRILQLGKLVDVAERRLSPSEMAQDLDAKSMAWWYHTNMDTASLFTGGGIVFGAGRSVYKGLDIRV